MTWLSRRNPLPSDSPSGSPSDSHPVAPLVGVALTLGLLVAACAGGSGAVDPPGESAAVSKPRGPLAAADGRSDSHSDGAAGTNDKKDPDDASPLSAYLGPSFRHSSSRPDEGTWVAVAPGQSSEKEQLAQQRKVEGLTAACMRDQGFTYVPVPPLTAAETESDEEFQLPPAEFTRQYGYGYSTIDRDDDGGAKDDPNKQIRAKLSAPARKAYDRALDGPPPTATAVTTKDLGCRAKATDKVYGKTGVTYSTRDGGVTTARSGDKTSATHQFDGLIADLGALFRRTDSAPQVERARHAWSDCMARAGHPGLEKTDDARGLVFDQMRKLAARHGGMSGEGLSSFPPRGVDPGQVAQVRKFELSVAHADASCRASSGYDATYRKVRYDLEMDFIARHRSELEQYRDTVAMPADSSGKGTK